MLSDATLLGLDFEDGGVSLSEYAARGIKAGIGPIDAAKQSRRDINGTLVDTSNPAFRKYRLSLSCDDMDSPGFGEVTTDADGHWPGDRVFVTVLPHMASAGAMNLTMLLKDWNVERDEWGAATSWSAELEQE